MYKPVSSRGLSQPIFVQRRGDDLTLHGDHEDAGDKGSDQEW